MLYDAHNRLIEEQEAKPRPITERLTTWEADDRNAIDASRGLSPARLDMIFREANGGDPRAQARLGAEIEEKDWTASQSLQTRRAAVLGLDWHVVPQRTFAEDKRAKMIAEAAEEMLRNVSGAETGQDMDLHGLMGAILGGILPGYSLAEIVWGMGGKYIEAFVEIERGMVTFDRSREPKIVSREHPMGLGLVPNKFVWAPYRARSGDATRGGLVRPLGWMFLFTSLGVKDLMRFVEKFGMPFVSARIDASAWKTERQKIAQLVRNFGSDGGAVFTKAVELEFLNAVTDSGELYFRLMEYFDQAKTKVIQGQLATSGESVGWSKGGAQDAVRQDILEADARTVEGAITTQVLRPWCMWAFGPDAPVPEFSLDYEPPEDLKSRAEVVEVLSRAGHKAKAEWIEEQFGIPVEREAGGGMRDARYGMRDTGSGALALSDRRAREDAARGASERVAERALREVLGDTAAMRAWLGPVGNAVEEALAGLPEDGATAEQEAEFRRRAGHLVRNMDGLFEQMDTRKLEDALVRAKIAADANGKAAEVAGLGG